VSLCLAVRVLPLKLTSQAGKPTQADLSDALDSLARVQFMKDFNYEFDSTPTGMKTGGSFVTLAKLCNVKRPSEAEQYIRDVILTFVFSFWLGAQGSPPHREFIVPDWMKGTYVDVVVFETLILTLEQMRRRMISMAKQ
jgi:hypothetical protein